MKYLSSYIGTTEFRVDYEVPEEWLETLTRVWNESIYLLRWLQHYRRAEKSNSLDLPPVEIGYIKINNNYLPFCHCAQHARIDKTKSWNKENIELRQAVRIIDPRWLTRPPIDNFSAISLRKPFAQKRCNWIKESTIPMIFINDYIGMIADIWATYQKGETSCPNYKKHQVTSLHSASLRHHGKVHADGLKISQMTIPVRNIEKRLLSKISLLRKDLEAGNYDNYPIFNKKKEEYSKKKTISSDREIIEKAINYISTPGCLHLITRGDKTYLQISSHLPVWIKEKNKDVGVDAGLDYLVHTTSNLKVKHRNDSKLEARIDGLRSRLSKMKFNSNNYKKCLIKIRKLETKKRLARKGRHNFTAQQIAKVNGRVAIKKINPKQAIDNPLPIIDKDKKIYLPNGKGEAKEKNRELHSCAIAQFMRILRQQCEKYGRELKEIDIEPEATPLEILEVADFPSVGAESKVSAQNPSAGGTREGEQVIVSIIPRKDENPTGETIYSTIAHPPIPCDGKMQRNRKREKAIG